MKLGSGSTDHFTVSMVAFEDHEEAMRADYCIGEFRKELSSSPNFEFHFSKMKPKYRIAFLKAVSGFEFFYFTVTINKSRLKGEGFNYPDSFYKYTCGMVFENAKPYLNDAVVVIDGSGGREFKDQLQTYLRRRMNAPGDGPRLIKKVKIQDSKKNNLLQLADMVCGAVARNHSGDSTYRDIISLREMSDKFWPK